MPRGGHRPGAGAPKHNFNAVKTGRYSQQLRIIGAALLGNPVLRAAYKRLCANLAKQALSSTPQKPDTRGFLAIFLNGKCRYFYLTPKNKSNQSNIVMIINTQNRPQK